MEETRIVMTIVDWMKLASDIGISMEQMLNELELLCDKMLDEIEKRKGTVSVQECFERLYCYQKGKKDIKEFLDRTAR